MWISQAERKELREDIRGLRLQVGNWQADYAAADARCHTLEIEIQRLLTTQEWFKHRLTQIEQERAQLIYAATGGTGLRPQEVKIAAPNFVGEPAIHETLNAQNNPFGTLGEDSDSPDDQIPAHLHEDVSAMPRFGK